MVSWCIGATALQTVIVTEALMYATFGFLGGLWVNSAEQCILRD